MKNILLLTFLMASFLQLEAQNYIEFQQRRIDRMDGEEDGQNPDSTFNFLYFEMIDSIQVQLSAPNLPSVDVKNIQLALYNELTYIDETFISKKEYYNSQFIHLYTFIEHLKQNKTAEFIQKSPNRSFEILPFIAFFPEMKTILLEKAAKEPLFIFNHYSQFSRVSYANEVLNIACQQAPVALKKYLNGSNPIYVGLQNSSYKSDQILLEIFHNFGRSSKAFLLLDPLVKEELTLEEAQNLFTQDEDNFFRTLIDIAATKNALGMASIPEELEYLSILKIRPINAEYEAHQSGARFAPLNTYNSKELYTIIVYSQDEIFTSTFTGAFQILLKKLKQEEINAYQLLQNVGFNEFRTFLKMCAGYGELEHFLSLMSSAEKEMLLQHFLNLNESKNLLKEAVSIADAMGSISDSITIGLIEEELYLQEFDSANKDVHLAYSLLIKLFKDKANIHQIRFDSIAANYDIAPLNYLDSTALFGKDEIHTEVHFFYDDDDGLVSYQSFISNFRNSAWQIIDKKEYVLIKSKSGKDIQVLANKAPYDKTAPQQMLALLESQQNDIEVLVHRGHSFYVNSSLEHLQEEMCLVVLGSCGGYHQVLEILNKAPKAQIIATKQIGTYTVNDPLIYQMLSNINQGENIQWEAFWLSLGKKFSKGSSAREKFLEYVPPYKNLGAGFIQAFRKYQEKL